MSQRRIFLFWLPLYASWLLMAAEGPVVSAAINRLPNEVIMLAAMGIVVSLSVTIESPIINLLATSTALGRDRHSYLLLRRFTIHWMLLLTGITILLAFTPLFELVVVDLMAVPAQVARWVRPGLRVMTFWSAAIAWRRFLQGFMIRFDHTRKVAWGTTVRLIASGGSVVILAIWSGWPGVIVGTTALMVGVIAEAVYATVAVRPIIRGELGSVSPPENGEELSYRKLFWFHLPLAGTSLLILLAQPLVAFSLARLPRPTLALAAWPIVFQLMLIARAAALALPEVVIALYEGGDGFRAIRRFTLTLVMASTIGFALFVLTPMLDFYLFGIQDAAGQVVELASSGLIYFTALPALTILISWIRGLLISQGATKTVSAGMLLNLGVTALVLFLAVHEQWAGITAAALALSVAATAEIIYLYWRVNHVLSVGSTIAEPLGSVSLS